VAAFSDDVAIGVLAAVSALNLDVPWIQPPSTVIVRGTT